MKVHGNFIEEKGLRGSMKKVGIEKETEREQERIIFLEYMYACMRRCIRPYVHTYT